MMFGRKIKVTLPGFFITDLRIRFEVEKSLVGYPNLAKIEIYNLSANSRALIEEKGLNISLYAGFEGNIALIFSGEVNNILHRKYPVDWVTEIYAKDSLKAINESTINKTLPAGVATEQVFDELVSNMQGITKGITQGLSDCLSNKRSLLRSLQLTGNVKDWLLKLSKDCGFDYSINEGVIETVVKNKPFLDVPPIIINQRNYMIGSPERTDVGVNVKRLLLPDVRLGRRFKLESVSEKINAGNLFFKKVPPIRNQGIYRIDKIVHVGDTHGEMWETRLNGRNF